MNTTKITIELPDELVRRAKAVGVEFEDRTDQIIALLEAQIEKWEAAKRLNEVAKQLQALPDELKPTPEEIEAEIRAYWSEKTDQSDSTEF